MMRRARSGRILMISSMGGFSAGAGFGAPGDPRQGRGGARERDMTPVVPAGNTPVTRRS
ncbi:MAG: hypothetical protein ACRDQ0_07680 [Pseudonocardia sp.]